MAQRSLKHSEAKALFIILLAAVMLGVVLCSLSHAHGSKHICHNHQGAQLQHCH